MSISSIFRKLINLEWPKHTWPLLSQAVLSGKAQKTYAALAVDECGNYETVKEAILKAYELVPEAYKKKIGELTKR